MKVLLRHLGDEYYVWKDATYANGCYRITEGRVYETNILAIKEDERKDSVECANCGAIIPNNPESIEQHFAEIEAKRDCFKCKNLSRGNGIDVDIHYEQNDDGTYKETRTVNLDLYCGIGWFSHPKINTEKAIGQCIFHKCRRSGVREITNIFLQYPEPFEKQLTIDVLNANKTPYHRYAQGYFEYDLKCRGTLFACVNELGIVNHFRIYHRGRVWIAYYSDKHDKFLFDDGNGHYSAEIPYYMSEQKYKLAKDKVTKLYKEASEG